MRERDLLTPKLRQSRRHPHLGSPLRKLLDSDLLLPAGYLGY